MDEDRLRTERRRSDHVPQGQVTDIMPQGHMPQGQVTDIATIESHKWLHGLNVTKGQSGKGTKF